MQEGKVFAFGQNVVRYQGLCALLWMKKVSAKDGCKCQFVWTVHPLHRLFGKFGKMLLFHTIPSYHTHTHILYTSVYVYGRIIPSYGNILDAPCIILYNFPQTSAWNIWCLWKLWYFHWSSAGLKKTHQQVSEIYRSDISERAVWLTTAKIMYFWTQHSLSVRL